MTSFMHEERLQSVHDVIRQIGVQAVLDLGCGPGPLLRRLAADSTLTRIVGVDQDQGALDRLREALPSGRGAAEPAIEIVHAPISTLGKRYRGFDICLLIETIEHMTEQVLNETSATVFGTLRPRYAIVTTPNIEFNQLLGVPPHRFRHPGHRFEWTREEFRVWCAEICKLFAYDFVRSDICGAHPQVGGATQLALFKQVAAGPAIGAR